MKLIFVRLIYFIYLKKEHKINELGEKIMNTKLVSTSVLTSLLLANYGMVVQADDRYPNAQEGNSRVDLTLQLGDSGGPSLPPGPGGEEIEPEETNPNSGELSLRYVSNLNFGTADISRNSQVVYAEKDRDINGVSFDNQVSIQDFRNDTERDGWTLNVARIGEFIPGSTIKMKPKIDVESAREASVTVSPTVTIVNTEKHEFARAARNNAAAIVTIAMADTGSNGVELEIPANTAAGDYSTTLLWNLVNGPEPETPDSR